MAKYSKQSVSDKSLEDAQAITKGTQKPGQTKDQSKLIAQGVAKGIELYKKQQKAKAREKDKQLKKTLKAKQEETEPTMDTPARSHLSAILLPWVLLITSWIGFVMFYSQNQ
jgi:hypothetical protein